MEPNTQFKNQGIPEGYRMCPSCQEPHIVSIGRKEEPIFTKFVYSMYCARDKCFFRFLSLFEKPISQIWFRYSDKDHDIKELKIDMKRGTL
jgi:hypothetical protein